MSQLIFDITKKFYLGTYHLNVNFICREKQINLGEFNLWEAKKFAQELRRAANELENL